MNNKAVKNLIKEYEEYAKKEGFQLNPDRVVVESLVKRLLENEEKYGSRYCPCRMITGNREGDKNKICPCIWHQNEVKEMGHCHCNLFVKQNEEKD